MGGQDEILEDHEPKLMKVAMPIKQEIKKESHKKNKRPQKDRFVLFGKQFSPQTDYILLRCSPCEGLPV